MEKEYEGMHTTKDSVEEVVSNNGKFVVFVIFAFIIIGSIWFILDSEYPIAKSIKGKIHDIIGYEEKEEKPIVINDYKMAKTTNNFINTQDHYKIQGRLNDLNNIYVEFDANIQIDEKYSQQRKVVIKTFLTMTVREVVSRYTTRELYMMQLNDFYRILCDELKLKSIEFRIKSFSIFPVKIKFDAHTEEEFARRMELNVRLEHRKLEHRIMEEKASTIMRQLQLEREQKLFEAETNKLVYDIHKDK